MKTKKLYMKPVIERAVVELEGGFCGSIQETTKVESTGHEVNTVSGSQVNQWNATDWE